MTKISIIVPVYKVESVLSECIDSILAQTYTDFELILVDDGSPDRCGSICDHYAEKDERIKVIHQKNGGLCAARNAGLNAAKGEYITFIDSDDVISNRYLYLHMGLAQKYDADIVTSLGSSFREGASPKYKCRRLSIREMSGKEAASTVYRSPWMISVNSWGKLYRTILFESVRFPEGIINEDQVVTPVLLYGAQKVVATNASVYGYRVRAGSIMHSKFTIKYYNHLKLMDANVSYFITHKDKEIAKAAIHTRNIFLNMYYIRACQNGFRRNVPSEYKTTLYHSLKYLWNNFPENKRKFIKWLIYPYWTSLCRVFISL